MVPGQAEITQLMIMLNLFDGNSRPSDISRNMDITLQGVQYHLKILKSKGYVNEENTLSQKGFEYLYTGLSNMRSFVSENIYKLDGMITWEAISRGRISKGETVYLKMENGYLCAFRDKVSDTVGTSLSNCEEGGILGVTRVKGIIDLEVKEVTIIVLPDVEKLGDMNDLVTRIGKEISKKSPDIYAVIGEEALIVSRNMDISGIVEYAPLEGSFEAARRGLSSVVLVSNRRFRLILDDLKSLENRNEEVPVKIISI